MPGRLGPPGCGSIQPQGMKTHNWIFFFVPWNERVIVDDVSLAADLFQRVEPFLPTLLENYDLVGFHERWRFYRYQSGQTFQPHRDGAYLRMETWEESTERAVVQRGQKDVLRTDILYGSQANASRHAQRNVA